MTTDPRSSEKSQANFVDRKSIKSFATASAVLTMLLNVIMLVYAQIRSQGMSNAILAGLALFLCIAYSLSFLKKDASSGIFEYTWLTALNSALLFSSLTGINSTLKKAGDGYNGQDTAKMIHTGKSAAIFRGNALEGAFGFSDLKNIIIPKQAWFNPTPENTLAVQKAKKETNQLATKTLQIITQTDTVIGNVIKAQNINHQKTDSLSTALYDLRAKYIQALGSVNNYGTTIADLNKKLEACCSRSAPAIPVSIQSDISSSGSKLAEQQKQQQMQVKVQQHWELQQNVQQTKISEQKKQVGQVKFQLQQQKLPQ